MKGPYFDHQYCITFDGNTPDNPTRTPLHATSYQEAVKEARRFAQINEIELSKFQIFYRVQAVVHSNWALVGQDTDYVETIRIIMGV